MIKIFSEYEMCRMERSDNSTGIEDAKRARKREKEIEKKGGEASIRRIHGFSAADYSNWLGRIKREQKQYISNLLAIVGSHQRCPAMP